MCIHKGCKKLWHKGKLDSWIYGKFEDERAHTNSPGIKEAGVVGDERDSHALLFPTERALHVKTHVEYKNRIKWNGKRKTEQLEYNKPPLSMVGRSLRSHNSNFCSQINCHWIEMHLSVPAEKSCRNKIPQLCGRSTVLIYCVTRRAACGTDSQITWNGRAVLGSWCSNLLL